VGDEFVLGFSVAVRHAEACEPSPLAALHLGVLVRLSDLMQESDVARRLTDLSNDSHRGHIFNGGLRNECEVFAPASEIVLRHWPISGSLAVAVERGEPGSLWAEELQRDPMAGFTFDASENLIRLAPAALQPSLNHLVISYHRWVYTLLPCD
jgi:hypothetical protein